MSTQHEKQIFSGKKSERSKKVLTDAAFSGIILKSLKQWHHSQAVRQRSAKPLFPSSILGGASISSDFIADFGAAPHPYRMRGLFFADECAWNSFGMLDMPNKAVYNKNYRS